MPDKVLHEVRVIETDDGFRIEIKGDKERMKKMFDKGLGRGFGPMGFFGRRWRHGPWGHGHGPRFGPPWAWGWWDEEPEEGDEEENSTAET